MKVRCKTREFAEMAQIAATVVPARSTKPVLSNLLLNAQTEALEILATDLEIGVRCRITDVTTKEAGSVLVPADRLVNIAKETSDETIDIETDGNVCQVYGQDSFYKILGDSPEDFPELPQLNEETAIKLDLATMKAMIRRTAFATAREKTRYALNGVFFVLDAKSITMVATDGRRLAYTKKKVSNPEGSDHSIIVPTKAMDEIERIQTSEETVRINVEKNQILAQVGNVLVISRLVEGSFPNYGDVIPKDCDRKLTLNVDEFHSAVRRAALLTTDESRSIRIRLENDTMVLSSRTPDAGEARIELKVKYQEDPLEIGFNPEYIVDLLKVVDDEEVQLELKETARPGLFKVGSDYQYVLMPINID